jgi:hypothetical protein
VLSRLVHLPQQGRLQGAWPTLHVVHLPIHASWLNQVEVYFSVIQRKILTPNDFGSLPEAEAALLAFQDCHQQIATPFEWKFTKSDLDLLLKRLAAHEPAPGANRLGLQIPNGGLPALLSAAAWYGSPA